MCAYKLWRCLKKNLYKTSPRLSPPLFSPPTSREHGEELSKVYPEFIYKKIFETKK